MKKIDRLIISMAFFILGLIAADAVVPLAIFFSTLLYSIFSTNTAMDSWSRQSEAWLLSYMATFAVVIILGLPALAFLLLIRKLNMYTTCGTGMITSVVMLVAMRGTQTFTEPGYAVQVFSVIGLAGGFVFWSVWLAGQRRIKRLEKLSIQAI
jgi:hypothetical protein